TRRKQFRLVPDLSCQSFFFHEKAELCLPGDFSRSCKPHMLPCYRGKHPPARRALQKALLDKIGLDNILNRVARLRQPCGNRFDADRPAAEIARDHVEIAPVELIEATMIDLQPRQSLIGDLTVDDIG